jgi:hypothetical protein
MSKDITKKMRKVGIKTRNTNDIVPLKHCHKRDICMTATVCRIKVIDMGMLTVE